ncbi:hypothetical protein ACFY65_33175 [Streptomyces cellulosae]
MPDNPALARLRAVLEESGFSLIAAQMGPMMINPSDVMHALALCLAPEIVALASWLESVLAEQADTGQGLAAAATRHRAGGLEGVHAGMDRPPPPPHQLCSPLTFKSLASTPPAATLVSCLVKAGSRSGSG